MAPPRAGNTSNKKYSKLVGAHSHQLRMISFSLNDTYHYLWWHIRHQLATEIIFHWRKRRPGIQSRFCFFPAALLWLRSQFANVAYKLSSCRALSARINKKITLWVMGAKNEFKWVILRKWSHFKGWDWKCAEKIQPRGMVRGCSSIWSNLC